jgi:hypothetical protein
MIWSTCYSRNARLWVTSQYLTVPDRSVSPERLFSSVVLVKRDFRGRLVDTILIDVMWTKQAPETQLESEEGEFPDIHTLYLHTTIYVTNTHQYLSLEHTNI